MPPGVAWFYQYSTIMVACKHNSVDLKTLISPQLLVQVCLLYEHAQCGVQLEVSWVKTR